MKNFIISYLSDNFVYIKANIKHYFENSKIFAITTAPLVSKGSLLEGRGRDEIKVLKESYRLKYSWELCEGLQKWRSKTVQWLTKYQIG